MAIEEIDFETNIGKRNVVLLWKNGAMSAYGDVDLYREEGTIRAYHVHTAAVKDGQIDKNETNPMITNCPKEINGYEEYRRPMEEALK
jgi:hypothetical protein